jgi:hypothetical protein
MDDIDAAIVSGSDAAALDYEHYSSDESSARESNQQHHEEEEESALKNLYDPNGDDEDEAYVYKHMRGGVEELVNLQIQQNTKARQMEDVSNTMQKTKNPHSLEQTQMSILKPRHSDAILSCPCCFQIVCMDCQRHEKYTNQYRAMFVMNIGVDWNNLVHSNDEQDETNMKINIISNPTIPDDVVELEKDQIESSSSRFITNIDDSAHVYYSVYCLQCKTEVAALGMHDEVYHFFGCLVSG